MLLYVILAVDFIVARLMERFTHFGNFFVQLIQVDICKDRRYDPALRCSAVRFVIPPFLQISCFQEFPNKCRQSCVFNLLADDRNERSVVDVVETTLNVALDKPTRSVKLMLYIL